MIEEFAARVPPELTERSGSVFYSGRRAFGQPSELYVLGLNPGGDVRNHLASTVSAHTRRVLQQEPDNWSAYRDESWEGARPGAYNMQPRMLHFFKKLNLDPGSVPSSSVVFLRSKSEAELKGDFREIARQCWPFHQAVMQELGVRVIVCLGEKSASWMRDQIDAHSPVDVFKEKNQRGWSSYTMSRIEDLWLCSLLTPGEPTGEILQRILRAW